MAAVVEKANILTLQYPDAFIIWNILGAANKGLGLVEAASDAFTKVTDLNPTYADGFSNLGVSLQEQGKMDEAIASCKKALSLNITKLCHSISLQQSVVMQKQNIT